MECRKMQQVHNFPPPTHTSFETSKLSGVHSYYYNPQLLYYGVAMKITVDAIIRRLPRKPRSFAVVRIVFVPPSTNTEIMVTSLPWVLHIFASRGGAKVQRQQ
jgi:hypothetical protein